MTYCVGVKLDEGLIFASDSRTHAGVDNYAKFCKMTVFDRPGDRVPAVGQRSRQPAPDEPGDTGDQDSRAGQIRSSLRGRHRSDRGRCRCS